MEHVDIDVGFLKDVLVKTRPIWSRPGTIANFNWVVFDGTKVYSHNGLLFLTLFSEITFEEPFALPADVVWALVSVKKMEADAIFKVEAKEYESSLNFVDGKGKTLFSGTYTYPWDIGDSLKSFYQPSEFADGEQVSQPDKLTQVYGVQEALKWCSRFIYKENVEYSNCYVHGNRMVVADGYRIASADVRCPDTKFIMGVDKALSTLPEPTSFFQTDFSGVLTDDASYVFSYMKAVGYTQNVLKYTPDVSVLKNDFKVVDSSGFKDTLRALKKVSEYKAKDQEVTIKFEKGEAHLLLTGARRQYDEYLFPVQKGISMEFSVHPDHLADLVDLADGGMVFYSPSQSYLYTYNLEPFRRSMSLWVNYSE